MAKAKRKLFCVGAAFLAASAAAFPAAAQRSITVLDAARKTPVFCETLITIEAVSTSPILCRRLDVPATAPNAAIGVVPPGMAMALTDARAFCDRCGATTFSIVFYGQANQALTTPSFSLSGAAPVADWHGAGPFIVLLGGSELKVGGVLPANRGDETIRAVATGYLTRADQLGQ